MIELANFLPDWASPPGATISDILEERGQSIAEFAQAMGDSVDDAHKLLKGYTHITDDVADHLAKVFGISAGFWISRESQFRDALERLAKNEEWLKELPVNDLIKFKWIRNTSNTADKIAACLDFFGVSAVSDWHRRYEGAARLAAFRTSKTFCSAEGAVLAWLRKGEIDSATMDCREWSLEEFRSTLPKIRALTRKKDPSVFIPELQKLCSECGVAVVIARAPSGCRASGATRFLSNNKALLMLSFRYLSDDHFWFTFFHEAGHLILHNTKELFLEGGDFCSGKEEQEANDFASNQLITPEHRSEMRSLPVDGRAVMRFARKIGVSPGIVIGQQQYLGNFTQRQLNNLKVRYTWAEE
ncbi:ImmA/IrrE family metallo-endopeptidase [Methylomonas sp. AM2-LC]|uniref:ImmA/IrrE family metallo-endopeptidase n=1 Tax=Methylomonas sp. AM2-LC TaxID=3153301 RepID=UPI003267CF8D